MKQTNFRWRYLIRRYIQGEWNRLLKILTSKSRCGTPNSDWVNGNKMCQPMVAVAPPRRERYSV